MSDPLQSLGRQPRVQTTTGARRREGRATRHLRTPHEPPESSPRGDGMKAQRARPPASIANFTTRAGSSKRGAHRCLSRAPRKRFRRQMSKAAAAAITNVAATSTRAYHSMEVLSSQLPPSSRSGIGFCPVVAPSFGSTPHAVGHCSMPRASARPSSARRRRQRGTETIDPRALARMGLRAQSRAMRTQWPRPAVARSTVRTPSARTR